MDAEEPITTANILPATTSVPVYYADVTLGTHTLTFTGEGVPDPSDITLVTITEGPAVDANSIANVPDGFVGVPTVITVSLYDELGNLVYNGTDQIEISIEDGPNAGAEFTIIDNEDGTYTLTYIPEVPGVDHVTIIVNGEEMEDSPFPSNVRASDPAYLIKISGDNQTTNVLGTITDDLLVGVFDNHDSPVGNARIQFEITGQPDGANRASLVNTEMRTNELGESITRLNAGTKVGQYTVMAFIADVDSVYFNVNVIACVPTFEDSDPCGPYEYIVTSSDYTPDVNSNVTVSAQLVDQFGNITPHSGVDLTWSTNLNGSFSAPTSTTNDQGVATVTYTVRGPVGSLHEVTATDQYTQDGTTEEIIPQGGGLAKIHIMGPDSLKVNNLGGPFTIILMDEFDNEIVAPRDLSMQLSIDDGVNFEVFTLSGGEQITATGDNIVIIDEQESRTEFHMSQNRTGIKSLKAHVVGNSEIPNGTKDVLFYNSPGDAQILSLVAGQGQKERILEQLAEKLTVTVIDQFDNPIPNMDITFTLTSTPSRAENMQMMLGTVLDNQKETGTSVQTALSPVGPITMTTDSLGKAAIIFILGDKAGDYEIEASSSGLNAVTFIATALPGQYTLYQNYPNPFNAGTNIVYEVPVESNVTITLYNAIGQKVATLVEETRPTGIFTIELDVSRLGLTSGVYVYHMSAYGLSTGSRYVKTHKMLYVK